MVLAGALIASAAALFLATSSWLLALAFLLGVGVLLERGVFRPLTGNLRNQVIASLGLILFLENLVVALWGPNALQWKVATTEQWVQLGELRFSLHHLGIIVVTLLLPSSVGPLLGDVLLQ
jgi:branched-subunit amino acid ABC-type transport system permease component